MNCLADKIARWCGLIVVHKSHVGIRTTLKFDQTKNILVWDLLRENNTPQICQECGKQVDILRYYDEILVRCEKNLH